jgi:hypothetical protein
MRRGVIVVALIGGFVGATTLPAAAQYVGGGERGWGVGVGFGSPGVYGAYAAYPGGYYAGPPAAYAYSAPAACPCATAAYGYSGSYAAYGYASPYGYAGPYAAAPGYGYESTYAYEPDYVYGSSSVVVGGGYREGVRSRAVTRSARTDVGNEVVGTSVRQRGTSLRTGSSVRSTSTIRERSRAENASMGGPASARAESTVGSGEPRSGTSTRARGQLRGATSAQPGEMSGQSGEMREMRMGR